MVIHYDNPTIDLLHTHFEQFRDKQTKLGIISVLSVMVTGLIYIFVVPFIPFDRIFLENHDK